MSDENEIDDAALEREARSGRKFSMEEAIARESKGTLKGVSAVPPLRQAQAEISNFIRGNLKDSSGALVRVLDVRMKNHATLVGSHLGDPLAALGSEVKRILDKKPVLHEFVRQVDQKYGEMYQERPHFQRPGQEPHPEDEYTHASVSDALELLLAQVEAR